MNGSVWSEAFSKAFCPRNKKRPRSLRYRTSKKCYSSSNENYVGYMHFVEIDVPQCWFERLSIPDIIRQRYLKYLISDRCNEMSKLKWCGVQGFCPNSCTSILNSIINRAEPLKNSRMLMIPCRFWRFTDRIRQRSLQSINSTNRWKPWKEKWFRLRGYHYH